MLNETEAKRKMFVPEYTVKSLGTAQSPSFVAQVKIVHKGVAWRKKGWSTKTSQHAKHKAAHSLLEALGVVCSEPQEPRQSEFAAGAYPRRPAHMQPKDVLLRKCAELNLGLPSFPVTWTAVGGRQKFCATVELGDRKVTAQAFTKKAACHGAAQRMLDSFESEGIPRTEQGRGRRNQQTGGLTSKSQLSEFCTRMGVSKPVFSKRREKPPTHDPTFDVMVQAAGVRMWGKAGASSPAKELGTLFRRNSFVRLTALAAVPLSVLVRCV